MPAIQPRILIIGSGFGGLGLAIQLKRAGIDSFTILEKSASLGGTWRDNLYPGAACDVPSMLYCFSFDQKTDWTRKWSPAAEIKEYLEDSAQRHDLLRHIRFGIEVEEARYDERSATWTVSSAGGERFIGEMLVSAVGQLHRPLIPHLPGLQEFAGASFHSARWNHDVDLHDKRVGVVGNAASAIQLIPEVAKQAAQVVIFQRSPNWMIPRNDRAYTATDHRRFKSIPGWARLYRAWLWLAHEIFLLPMILRKPWATRMYTRLATEYLQQTVRDAGLRAQLLPDYPIGGKRVLISDDYYQTLNRDNVSIDIGRILEISADMVKTDSGREHKLDVLILATGFQTNPFLAPMRIFGRGGRSLEKEWVNGAHAYYGMTVSGFPNFFMMYGPNTNLGHNSIIFMLECQARYILSAVRVLMRYDLCSVDVRDDVMRTFNVELQRALRGTAWAAAGNSWYKDAAGRITNNWPYSTARYWWETRQLRLSDYRTEPRHAERIPQTLTAAQQAAA
jgi:cation diffusion facilitator CzcD-associated flavoprotein CzcO